MKNETAIKDMALEDQVAYWRQHARNWEKRAKSSHRILEALRSALDRQGVPSEATNPSDSLEHTAPRGRTTREA